MHLPHSLTTESVRPFKHTGVMATALRSLAEESPLAKDRTSAQ